MAHWIDTYPHNIFTSVILKDNKIILWKTGGHTLKDNYLIDKTKYSYFENCFVANCKEEHDLIFEERSIEWFKQWELHENFNGFSPY